MQEDLSELYEDSSARWVLLHLLRADNARQLPPEARQVLEPPPKPRLSSEGVPAASLPDSNDAVSSEAEVRAA
jgi:hypothetical protein